MIWIYIVGGIFVLLGFSAFLGAPYVPSRRKDLGVLFEELHPIGRKDLVLDLGSGDGVVLREASRRGAQAVGFEVHPLFVYISRFLSRGDRNVSIQLANVWTTPFPDGVTLVYAFSVARDGKRLTRKVQREANRLGRTLTLVCYGNPLPKREPVRLHGAYELYEFRPLHPSKP